MGAFKVVLNGDAASYDLKPPRPPVKVRAPRYGFQRPAPVASSAAPVPAVLSASAGQWPASLCSRAWMRQPVFSHASPSVASHSLRSRSSSQI